MTRQELEIKAKEFDSKLKRHPMSSEELQKVLCDFVEALRQPPVSGSLQDRLFELANDFAKDKQGDVAVKLHGIHNGLQ